MTEGYFLHNSNIPENQNYTGKYPEPVKYVNETMKRIERSEFTKWYSEVADQTFNLREERKKIVE